jgi:CxxC motif-containing protein
VLSFRESLKAAAALVVLLAAVIFETGRQMPGHPKPTTPAEMAAQERSKPPPSLTALNALTEPKRVRTTTIRTDGAEEKRIESARSATAPNALTEPKRVRTTTIRTNRAEENRTEPPQSTVPIAPAEP